MKLTPEQQAVLDGSKGEVMAKVMKTLVMYGDAFGAEKMVPITSTYGTSAAFFVLSRANEGFISRSMTCMTS